MSVRSAGQLLAGIGALLGICTAGAGCQSGSIRPHSVAPPAGQVRTAPRSDGIQQAVSVMKPVPAGAPSGNGVVVSDYRSTDRVGTEEGRDGAPTGAYVKR